MVLLLPFHRTMDAVVKLLPPTTRLNAAEPAIFEGGDSVVMYGVATATLMLSKNVVWLRLFAAFQ